MESRPLVLSDPDLLAEFVRESEFKTFFEKRFAAPPDLAALLFRDGALIDAFKGTQFTFGGLWENMKGVIGGSHHYAVMLADLKPFQVQFAVKGISKDKVEVAGTATLELQLDPDKPTNILGLMSGVSRNQTEPVPTTGRKALSRFDVLSRIEPQFRDRVFEAAIGRHNSDEFRGNRGLQDQIQADMMKEAERICGDIGVMVRNGSIVWALNAAEREELARAEVARQQAMLDYQLELMKRDVARQGDATSVKIQSNLDLTKLQQASDDELALMVLKSEVAFIDAREAEARRQEAEALQHEISILRSERAGRFENELAESGQVIDLTKEKARLREVERDIDTLDRKHAAEMRRMETELELELRRKGAINEVDIDEAQVSAKIRQTREWNKLAQENLGGLGHIQEDLEDRKADRGIKLGKAETENRIGLMDAEARSRVDQLGAAAGMSPEQISALTASYSEGAAAARIEEVKARAASGEQVAQVVRDMSAEMREETRLSREHEQRMLETGMKGATGVAYGAGASGAVPKADGTPEAPAASVECPKCGKTLSAKANFCGGCGHQMRT